MTEKASNGALVRAVSPGISALQVDDDVLNHIAQNGTDLQFGARPLRRAIQRMVEDALADGILSGEIPDDSEIEVDAGEKGLVFRPLEAKPAE